jgi:predicted aminopeptidase
MTAGCKWRVTLPVMWLEALKFMKKRSTAVILCALSAIILVVVGLSGCTNLGYYWQNTQGHIAVMNAAKPVQEWLDDPQTSPATKARLALAQRIREFASTELVLPNNASYRRYADLKRSAVVWNVVAAPPYSLQLKTWCFAVVGCVSYRGYYTEADARAEAERVKMEGMEVNVYGVPAYSTLGYLNWAGGDPLLSTFIQYPEGELARMIFHELAHQVLYVKDDTMFNESFATAVERLGGQQWLAKNGSEAARKEYAAFDSKRREFRALTLRARERLAGVYVQHAPNFLEEISADHKTATEKSKQQAMQQLRDEYAQLKASWGGYAGYDRFIAQANNASLGALAAYDELVPQFEAAYEKQGKSWPAFYAAIQAITPLPKEARRTALADMSK